jgi:hypothetical protein
VGGVGSPVGVCGRGGVGFGTLGSGGTGGRGYEVRGGAGRLGRRGCRPGSRCRDLDAAESEVTESRADFADFERWPLPSLSSDVCCPSAVPCPSPRSCVCRRASSLCPRFPSWRHPSRPRSVTPPSGCAALALAEPALRPPELPSPSVPLTVMHPESVAVTSTPATVRARARTIPLVRGTTVDRRTTRPPGAGSWERPAQLPLAARGHARSLGGHARTAPLTLTRSPVREAGRRRCRSGALPRGRRSLRPPTPRLRGRRPHRRPCAAWARGRS